MLQNKCDRASHPVASFVDLSSCLPAARSSGSTVLVRQRSHLRGVPHLPALAAEHDSANMIRRTTSLQPLRWLVAQPAPRASCRGGRNARATGTRSRALPIFPRQFTLENCRSAAGFTAIVVRQAVRIATYSLNPLSGRMLRPATEKHFVLVKKLWTMRLACGRLRKSPHESRPEKCALQSFNNLDVVKK
jgi:hypothetical protein